MRAVLFLIFSLLFTACESQLPTLHISIYCRYDQQEGKIKAEAIFTEDDASGKPQVKVFQSGVSFLGSNMETRNLPGAIRYESNRSIRLPEQLPLYFREDSDREKNILLPMNPIHSISLPGETLSKSQGGTLKFEGKPLSDEEQITFLFTDAQRQNHSIELSGQVKGSEIKITPSDISSFATGPAEFYLVRTLKQKSREKYYDISIQTEFYSEIFNVVIGE